MTEELRHRLREELDSRGRPPMVGLVETAVRQGRGRRRARSLLGGGVAALGVAAAVGLVFAGQAYTAHTGPTSRTTAQTAAPLVAPPRAAASTVAARAKRVVPTLAPGRVPATGRGMLELLRQQLPAETVSSHYGVTTDDSRHVEEYLQTPRGEGMIRVDIAPPAGNPATCASFDGEGSCQMLANGDLVLVTALAHNCIGTHSVTVVKPDGSTVQMDLSTCLDWNGVTNPASPPALTVDQAVTLLTDPRWDYAMSPALVDQGAVDFPTLTTFG